MLESGSEADRSGKRHYIILEEGKKNSSIYLIRPKRGDQEGSVRVRGRFIRMDEQFRILRSAWCHGARKKKALRFCGEKKD